MKLSWSVRVCTHGLETKLACEGFYLWVRPLWAGEAELEHGVLYLWDTPVGGGEAEMECEGLYCWVQLVGASETKLGCLVLHLLFLLGELFVLHLSCYVVV